MNTGDLRALLAERAVDADGGAPTVDARLAGARGKARKIRARRLAGAGIAAVATMAIAIGIGNPAILQSDDPEPVNPSDDLVLPDYVHGGVKIGEARVQGPSTTSSVTVTPGTLPLVLVVKCDRSVSFSVTKDETGAEPIRLSGGQCAEQEQRTSTLERAAPGDEELIEPDEPVTLTITVDGVYDEAHDLTPGIRPGGGVVLGIYESVPWDEYQFPARPAELVDLDGVMSAPLRGGRVVESAADPNEPVTTQFVGDGVSIDLRSQTPGRMKIYIEGEEVGSATFWDYTGMSSQYETGWEGGEYAKLPAEGVEITFVPQDFTGAWRAKVVQCTQYADGSVGCGP